MKTYQITFITNEEQNDFIKKSIESLDGKILKDESLGRKKFSYPIKKEVSGFYYNIIINIDHSKLPELEKKLRANNSILRYLLVTWEKDKVVTKPPKEKTVIKDKELKVEKEVKPEPEKSIEEKTITEKEIPSKTIVSKKDKGETILEDKPKTEKADKTTIKLEPVKPEKEIPEEDRLKQLEEKLDKLLKE